MKNYVKDVALDVELRLMVKSSQLLSQSHPVPVTLTGFQHL